MDSPDIVLRPPMQTHSNSRYMAFLFTNSMLATWQIKKRLRRRLYRILQWNNTIVIQVTKKVLLVIIIDRTTMSIFTRIEFKTYGFNRVMIKRCIHPIFQGFLVKISIPP
ncbi:hypothetical protein DERF_008100 [Dermatophagoides farinae]|uniref:Uncharacterized protein n=1 Tax=Dermatophagoides farinae TaxID=6954 RepID=A0A922L6M8_DERFA|nr:hypothetical protein DERF_008100 [Dermatophagoides farinae]